MFKNIILLAVSSVLSVMFALGVLSVVSENTLYKENASSHEFRIPHPQLGWVLAPSSSYTYETERGMIRVDYNSKGWRDSERKERKKRGVTRIAVLGDSFIEAYTVENENTVSKKLERFLQQKSKNIEVLNFGVGGYGTLQEYIVYESIVKAYDPDIVLLGFTLVNDLENNDYLLSKASARGPRYKGVFRPFVATEGSQWKVAMPINYDDAMKSYNEYVTEKNPWYASLVEKSSALQVAQRGIDNMMSMPSALLEDSYGNTNMPTKDIAQRGEHYCEENEHIARSWNTTQQILNRMKGSVEESGGTFMVFSVPAEREVHPETVDLSSGKYCLDDIPAYKKLASITSSLDIPYLHLLPYFKREHEQYNLHLFDTKDDHWNQDGHELAASILYDWLEEQKELESRL